MKPNGKISETIKKWLKKASDYTVEESKVLSIRALEAGKLTKLNARRYRIKRALEETCAEIGKQLLEFVEAGKKGNISDAPSVKGLIDKAAAAQRELHQLDEEIDYFKKDCDYKVKEIHQKAA